MGRGGDDPSALAAEAVLGVIESASGSNGASAIDSDR